MALTKLTTHLKHGQRSVRERIEVHPITFTVVILGEYFLCCALFTGGFMIAEAAAEQNHTENTERPPLQTQPIMPNAT